MIRFTQPFRAAPSIPRPLAFVMLVCALLAFPPPAARAGGEVGSVAPNFTLNNVLPGPTTVTLGQYAGSVVVIAFFAEW